MSEYLLKATGIYKNFSITKNYRKFTTQALKGVDFSIRPDSIIAVVGQSGSGKSTLARVLIGLEKADSGNIYVSCDQKDIQIVFQNPYTSLNPRMKVRDILLEPLMFVMRNKKSQALKEVAKLLSKVGLDGDCLPKFPNQLSGGQAQRVAIARSLTVKPKILICDEVTSSLDVIVGKKIMDMLSELKRDYLSSLIFISHNIALISKYCDDLYIMNNGIVEESGNTKSVLGNPKSIYTKTLINSSRRIQL